MRLRGLGGQSDSVDDPFVIIGLEERLGMVLNAVSAFEVGRLPAAKVVEVQAAAFFELVRRSVLSAGRRPLLVVLDRVVLGQLRLLMQMYLLPLLLTELRCHVYRVAPLLDRGGHRIAQ